MRKRMIFLLVSLLLVFLVTGCSGKKDDELKTIRVACFPNVTHTQALINIQEGRFQEILGEDVKVEWKYFNSGNPEIEAFFAGELDLGLIGPIPATNGHARSGGEIIILSGATNGGAVLIANEDSDIKNISDLSGKKVAVPSFGNTQDFMLRMMLAENGLSETTKGGTVEIIPVKNPDLKSFFAQKHIDAAFVPEPWGSQLVIETGAKIVLDVNETWRNGDYPTTVVIGRKEFVEENPEIVKKFLDSHVGIINDYIENNINIANKINSQILEITGSQLDDKVLAEALPRITMSWDPRTDAVESLAKAMKEHEFIDTDVNINQLFDFSILNEVLKEAGGDPLVLGN